MKPSCKKVATAVAIAAFLLIHFSCKAQAPASLAGDSIFLHVTGSNDGYWIFTADDSTNAFTNYSIYSGSTYGDLAGLYYYGVSPSNAFSGTVQMFQPVSDGARTFTMTFTNATTGSYRASSTPLLNLEIGNFFLAAGTVPASVAGMTFNCTVSDGLFPFSTNGTFTLITSASNTYTITVPDYPLGSSQGTFSLSPINNSMAALSLTDSLVGSLTMYIGYADKISGMYAITAANGGFQVGTFRSPQMPFFTDEVDLGGDWYWLSEGPDHVFGYAYMGYFPYVFHADMGFEYFMDAGYATHGAYLYDFSDGAWLYTEPGMFPYMYDYTLGHWVWYEPKPKTTDHYTSNPRWFYDFTAKQWINHLSPTAF